jgi:hypothetical protein
VLRLALIGLVARIAVGLGLACLFAALLALLRTDTSFVDGFRISVWIVGCLLLLLAVAGNSPAMRMGTIDPLAASFFPDLTRKMGEAYDEHSGTRLSPGALFVVAALPFFALGVILG